MDCAINNPFVDQHVDQECNQLVDPIVNHGADPEVTIIDDEMIEIKKLHQILFQVLRQKLPVSALIQSHKECTIDNINNKLFPLDNSSPEVYRTIARIIVETDHSVPNIRIPEELSISKEKDESHVHDKQQLFDNLNQIKTWRELIINTLPEREQIPDEQVFADLVREIDDPSIQKNLYWLLSWSLRITFASSNSMWNNTMVDDNLGFYKLSYWIYYTQVYKNAKLFDICIEKWPATICQEISSFEFLNNTFLTARIIERNERKITPDDDEFGHVRNIMLRMVPWPIDLTENDLTELLSCGIFPCATHLRDVIFLDASVMFGGVPWIHDWFHAITYVSPSKIHLESKSFLSLDSENQPDPMIIKKCDDMFFWWNHYNIFVNHAVESSRSDHWSDEEKHLLFFVVHEVFGSAIEKCGWILDMNYEHIRKIHDHTLRKYLHIISSKKQKYISDPITDYKYLEFFTKLRNILVRIVRDQIIEQNAIKINAIPMELHVMSLPKHLTLVSDVWLAKFPIIMNFNMIKGIKTYDVLYGFILKEEPQTSQIIAKSNDIQQCITCFKAVRAYDLNVIDSIMEWMRSIP